MALFKQFLRPMSRLTQYNPYLPDTPMPGVAPLLGHDNAGQSDDPNMPWVQTLGGHSQVPPQPTNQPSATPEPAMRGQGPMSMEQVMANDQPMPVRTPGEPGRPMIGAVGSASPYEMPQNPSGTGVAGAASRPRIYEPELPAPPSLFKGTLPGAASQPGTTTQDIYQQIGDLDKRIEATGKGQDEGKPREHSFWKRLGKGIVDGYKNWDGQGGLVGLGVSALGGGVSSAASPQAHQVGQLKAEKAGLFKQYSQAAAYETDQAKRGLIQAQTADEVNQVQNRNAQTMLQMERLEADRRKEAAAGKNWKLTEINGKYYKQFPDGRTEFIEEKTKDLTSEQIKADADAAKANREIDEENRKAEAKWQAEYDDAKNKRAALILEGEEAQNEAGQIEQQLATEDDPDERRKMRAKATELRAKGRSLIRRGNEYKLPARPKARAANVKAPNLTGKTVTMAEIEAIAKKTGKTIEQVKQMAKGYTIK